MENAKFQEPTTYSKIYTGDRFRLASDPRGVTYRKGSGGFGIYESILSEEDALILPAREFDYRRAWREAARPAFEALTAPMRAAFDAVASAARNGGQDKTCRLVGTVEGTDQSIFDYALEVTALLSVDELARVAVVAEAAGHWSPSGDPLGIQKVGAGWKVVNVLDQVLAKRHGLEHDRFHKTEKGVSVRIIDGRVRVGYSDDDCWLWFECGIASAENLEEARAVFAKVGTFRKGGGGFERLAQAIAAKQIAREKCGYTRALLELTPFMAPKGYLEDDCIYCGGSPLWGTDSDHDKGCQTGEKLREEALRARAIRQAEELGIPAPDMAAAELDTREVCARIASGYYEGSKAAKAAAVYALRDAVSEGPKDAREKALFLAYCELSDLLSDERVTLPDEHRKGAEEAYDALRAVMDPDASCVADREAGGQA